MQKNKKIVLIIIAIIFVIIASIFGILFYFCSPVSKNYEEHNIVVPSGSSLGDIANILKKAGLIRNENVFKIYLKIKKVNNVYAAAYYLSPSMNIQEIVKTLESGGHNESEITITFKEGINMRKVAQIIADNTNNTYEDVMNTLADKEYINSLIKKYWFLTDEITNSSIYYPLEGYLFPDTYRISSKDASVKEIFEIMLDEMNNVLNNYKEDIDKNNYTIHQILTMASVTQSEGLNEEDFKKIASVFYNRMNDKMALGSCTTSYYGVKKEMTDELYLSDINAINSYNTRGNFPVLFPIGPISNPGLKAIEAVVKPIATDYYYFVSDKNHKLYFTKTNNEHEAMIEELQEKGLWYEW